MSDLLSPTLQALLDHRQLNYSSLITGQIPVFVPLDLTYVAYEQHSKLSLFFALITYSPFVIFIALATLIAFRREIEALNISVALVLSTILNSFLKDWFAHARPIHSFKAGHGMPSDHAQFMSFFAVYLVCFLWSRSFITRTVCIVLTLLLPLLVLLVGISRVYLHVHTVAQVAVGIAIGSLLGGLYFLFCRAYVYPLYPKLLSLSISQALYLKDTTNVPDVMRFEHEAYLAYHRWSAELMKSSAKSNGQHQHHLEGSDIDAMMKEHRLLNQHARSKKDH